MYYNYFPQRKHGVMLESPFGLLEGVLSHSFNINKDKIALILPPDPSHKGTMNNRVVNMLFDSFQSHHFTTLKINYRGVGNSKGNSTTHEDKILDALIALDWLIKKCENNETHHPTIYLAGFSLGGWIALQCAMRRPEITHFITINSVLDASSFNMLTPCPSGLIIQADQDFLSKNNSSDKFHTQLITQKGCSIHYSNFEDDHYFNNCFDELQENIQEYIASNNKIAKKFD